MNKFRKIILYLKRKKLDLLYVFSEKQYNKSMIKYLKYMGINLNGIPKFVARDVKFDLTSPNMISIGDGTVITSKCTLLTHDYSIECGLVSIGKEDPVYESLFLKKIKIGNNCFIGQNSFIKPGTNIGDNCIIAAGTVVSGIIPDNSIVIGNPGIVVKKTDEWAKVKFSEKNTLMEIGEIDEDKSA